MCITPFVNRVKHFVHGAGIACANEHRCSALEECSLPPPRLVYTHSRTQDLIAVTYVPSGKRLVFTKGILSSCVPENSTTEVMCDITNRVRCPRNRPLISLPSFRGVAKCSGAASCYPPRCIRGAVVCVVRLCPIAVIPRGNGVPISLNVHLSKLIPTPSPSVLENKLSPAINSRTRVSQNRRNCVPVNLYLTRTAISSGP